MNDQLEIRKYPIGKFMKPDPISDETIGKWVASIEDLPAQLGKLMAGVAEDRLEAQYRPGGWSVRQIIHHIADSHINAYIRMKLALTEDSPVIKPYNENAWSLLADVEVVDVKVSLDLLKNVHIRWVALLKSLNSAELKRTFYHPENKVNVALAESIGLYAWHGEHHLAHIKEALGKQI